MSNTVIKIDNVSKLYRLGLVGKRSLKDDLNRWLYRVRGKEDPYLKIGEENDRTKKGASDYIWALKNVSFDVPQGEVVGIIGRNGAGKSTLLKILSKVTSPTTGMIKSKGKIASLLEVGTGFHPDLTGRDNIFLNGAILGMTRKEIQGKLDEIVDFSGVERYIDTPVKRYSSGMYVRLAFSVAAHLDPEILIIDEVLAVGDAEFQKKCLGKMKDVSKNGGRTVLFVSHNMTAVKSLCEKGVLLVNGHVKTAGPANDVVEEYLKEALYKLDKRFADYTAEGGYGNDFIKIMRVQVESQEDIITISDEISVFFEFECFVDNFNLNICMVLFTRQQLCVFNSRSPVIKAVKGKFHARCRIPANLLNDDVFSVTFFAIKDSSSALLVIEDIISFEVHDDTRNGNWYGKWIGVVRPKLDWEFNPL